MFKINTSLRLCNCYDMDSEYNHTPLFTDYLKQNEFFGARTVYLEIDEVSYQKKNTNIKIDYSLEDLKFVNYVVLFNEDGTKYYYFIMDKVYINEHTTNLILKLDVIQTYMFKLNFSDCLIEREHCNRWYSNNLPIKYIQDEGLETGEYVVQRTTDIYNYGNKGSYFISSSDRIGVSNEGRVGEKNDTTTDDTPISSEWVKKNSYLTMDEMKINAKLFWQYFKSKGWTLNSVCGMLGNIQTESYINPAIWEGLDNTNVENGYGLVQWTPSTKYTSWGGSEYANGDKQCERIVYEMENNIQWYSTSAYPLSFKQFSQSTETPTYLAKAFIENYERPFDTNQPLRGSQAEFWYNYLK